jgi:hypothetical protein
MGGIRPYYRRHRPAPQNEADYLRDLSLRWLIGRLKQQGKLAPTLGGNIRGLLPVFPPSPPESVRALVANMLMDGGVCQHVDLQNARVETSAVADPVAATRASLVKRAAATVFAAVSPHIGVRMKPIIVWIPMGPKDDPDPPAPFHVDESTGKMDSEPGKNLYSPRALLELKFYGTAAPAVYHPTLKSLAAMAYGDYFPVERGKELRAMVSTALMSASPGWCGTIGPGVGTLELLGEPFEGNYDMSQQHLLRLAYAYFDDLTDAAGERLVRQLLARGRIHRVNLDDTFTSGPVPLDWIRAGDAVPAAASFVIPGGGLHKNIGETENHILMMQTARYLSNQLMYQRHPDRRYDNRRNGFNGAPTCMDLLLYLLRNILLDDFSEYNAKSYQHETRTALLNLFNFAYDHEVRLAARMVLDYLSARLAVSSNDCRRMVPFRRKNEGRNVARTAAGRMAVGLVDSTGADPMTEHMAMLSGATRAYDVRAEPHRPLPWSIASGGGDGMLDMLSDYRMPTPIHDLFVNDLHRRFYQVLNRRPLGPVEVTGRNATNSEGFAGSPGYLITAGGAPAPHAIDPYFLFVLTPKQDQQRGVALPTSFMPTGESAGNNPDAPDKATAGYAAAAMHLIQIGRFAQEGPVRNYGVAPDFLCGPYLFLPRWCTDAIDPAYRKGKFDFVNKRGLPGRPGFYLAILRDGDFAAIEAFDTWLHPELSFDDFRRHVWARNGQLSDDGLRALEELTYTTENGNRIHFLMWQENEDSDDADHGAYIYTIDWSGNDATDRMPDVPSDRFLRGTVLNSAGDGLVTITNPSLQQTITLDMRDQQHPRRISERNETESAGANEEVWADFEWSDVEPSVGDFFRPFRTLADGVNAVAARGVINLVPGATGERGVLNRGKRLRLHAPIGGVRIGSLA